MSRETDNALGVLLDGAERRRSCLAVRSRSERQALERRVAKGGVVQPVRGTFARSEYWSGLSPSERHRHVLRALSGTHASWAFCQSSAAATYHLPVARRLLGEIHVAAESYEHVRDTSIITRRYVPYRDVRVVEGIRVISPLQTAFDCARTLEFADALAAVDAALARGLFDEDGLVTYFAEMGGCKGVARARRVARYADGRSESWGESVACATMIDLGFAVPELQREYLDPVDGRRMRVDFLWARPDGVRIAGEFDGREKYVDQRMTHGRDLVDVLLAERRRESRMSASVDRIVRFSYADVMNACYFSRLLDSFGVPRQQEAPRTTAAR